MGWVNELYEAYPGVFNANGTPISIAAECVESDADNRSGMRKFLWSIGKITLLPLIPAEYVENSNWKLTVTIGEAEVSDVLVNETREERGSFLPIGYLCFFGDDNDERFQVLRRNFWCDEADVRMQMKAFGAGIAAELIAMERDGRIKIGEKVMSEAGEPQLTEQQDERVQILSEEHKENLNSLLKAGIITEEEYKKEIEREEK